MLIVGSLSAQTINIGVFRSYSLKHVRVKSSNGRVSITSGGQSVAELEANQFADVEYNNGSVLIEVNGEAKGTYASISITSTGNVLTMTPVVPSKRARSYQGAYIVKALGGKLLVINRVSMPNYLAGVIESEGGGGRHIEYYKVQALMSRTYALKNKRRHAKDGFDLCDGVHCQAYHQMLQHTSDIRTAVKETKGKVLVDQRNKLVTTYFSANCGGQVCDASHVWNNSVPHVETFLDTFCIHTRQATWTKKISQYSWKNFLVKQYGYPIQDPAMEARIFDFEQELSLIHI